MGFRFRKSINLGKGFRINLSKSGLGYSWGTKGIRLTKTAKGSMRTTLGVPGTGLSYSTETSGKTNRRKKRKEEKEDRPIGYDERDTDVQEAPEKKGQAQETSAWIVILKVALWILTGFFTLVAVANIPQPVGFVALAAAVLLLPIELWQNLTNKFINLNSWLKLLVIVALIVATFIMGPFKGFAKWLPEQQKPTSATVAEEQGQTVGAEQEQISAQQEYILNTGTKKFHDPECGSVASMKEEKKETYYGFREDLLEKGYSPCGNCDP